MSPLAVVSIVLGLIGQPAQLVERAMQPDMVLGAESEVCRLATQQVLAAVAEAMARNPGFVVSIRCRLERGA